jgi:hypothetical protein
MSKNTIQKEALKSVPSEYRVLKKHEIVRVDDWLWTSGSKEWIKANFLVGESKAADFICVIREQVSISPESV